MSVMGEGGKCRIVRQAALLRTIFVWRLPCGEDRPPQSAISNSFLLAAALDSGAEADLLTSGNRKNTGGALHHSLCTILCLAPVQHISCLGLTRPLADLAVLGQELAVRPKHAARVVQLACAALRDGAAHQRHTRGARRRC